MLDEPEQSNTEKEPLETFPGGITPATRESTEPQSPAYALWSWDKNALYGVLMYSCIYVLLWQYLCFLRGLVDGQVLPRCSFVL